MTRGAALLATALAVVVGCGSSPLQPDGGSGAGGAAGSSAGGSTGGTAAGGVGGTAAGGTGGMGGTGGTGGIGGGTVPPEYRVQLDAARTLWAAAKGSCATYSYDRRFLSAFGFAASTEVRVHGDVATRRRYSTGSWRDGGTVFADGGGGWMIVWDETGGEVGTHVTVSPVYPASTVEQLLAECEAVLAYDPADYFLNLELDPARGVPRVCTNTLRNCADDCEYGIQAPSFSCAPLPQ